MAYVSIAKASPCPASLMTRYTPTCGTKSWTSFSQLFQWYLWHFSTIFFDWPIFSNGVRITAFWKCFDIDLNFSAISSAVLLYCIFFACLLNSLHYKSVSLCLYKLIHVFSMVKNVFHPLHCFSFFRGFSMYELLLMKGTQK